MPQYFMHVQHISSGFEKVGYATTNNIPNFVRLLGSYGWVLVKAYREVVSPKDKELIKSGEIRLINTSMEETKDA